MSEYERMPPIAIREEIAKGLSKRRKVHYIGQIALARLASVSRNTVQRIENAEPVSRELRGRVLRAMNAFEGLAEMLSP